MTLYPDAPRIPVSSPYKAPGIAWGPVARDFLRGCCNGAGLACIAVGAGTIIDALVDMRSPVVVVVLSAAGILAGAVHATQIMAAHR